MEGKKKLKLKENELYSERIKLNQNSNKTEYELPNPINNISIPKMYYNLKSETFKTKEPNNLLSPEIKEDIFKYYNNNKSIDDYDFTEKQRTNFLYERFQKEQKLNCNILVRDSNFYVYSETKHFLLSAHKIKKKLRVNYIISANHENDKKIAQINSNLFKNEYFLYDKGISPKKINEESNEELRKYLLQIQLKKENNFKIGYIFIPKESYIKNKYYNKDKNKKDKLSTFKINDEIILYKTEMPEFDFLKKYYVYTFSSRVKEKSEHNFRIIDKNSNKILLECGKISNNSFSMDFSAPFSPLEAFGICISYLN